MISCLMWSDFHSPRPQIQISIKKKTLIHYLIYRLILFNIIFTITTNRFFCFCVCTDTRGQLPYTVTVQTNFARDRETYYRNLFTMK